MSIEKQCNCLPGMSGECESCMAYSKIITQEEIIETTKLLMENWPHIKKLILDRIRNDTLNENELFHLGQIVAGGERLKSLLEKQDG